MLRHSFHSEGHNECRIRELPSLLALKQHAPHERQGQHENHDISRKQLQAHACKFIRDEQLASHDIHGGQDVLRQLPSCDRQLYGHQPPS